MATHCPPNPPNASKPLEEWAAVTLSFRSARNWPDPGAFSERRHITKLYVGVVSLICALACTLYPVEAQPAKEDRIVIGYVAPENPEHMPVFTLLKDNEALERVRNLLAPIRWPRTLRLEIKGCDGESNAGTKKGRSPSATSSSKTSGRTPTHQDDLPPSRRRMRSSVRSWSLPA